MLQYVEAFIFFSSHAITKVVRASETKSIQIVDDDDERLPLHLE